MKKEIGVRKSMPKGKRITKFWEYRYKIPPDNIKGWVLTNKMLILPSITDRFKQPLTK